MGYVLGIDGGGTKTVCLLIDSAGEVVGRGEAGPSNYQTVGLDMAGQSIAIAIKRAVHPEIDFSQIEAIGLGLAGVGRPEDQVVVHSMVQQLPYRNDEPVELAIPPERVFVSHDCAIALAGGTRDNVGIVTVAGTGSIAYGRNQAGVSQRGRLFTLMSLMDRRRKPTPAVIAGLARLVKMIMRPRQSGIFR